MDGLVKDGWSGRGTARGAIGGGGSVNALEVVQVVMLLMLLSCKRP